MYLEPDLERRTSPAVIADRERPLRLGVSREMPLAAIREFEADSQPAWPHGPIGMHPAAVESVSRPTITDTSALKPSGNTLN